MKGKEIVATRLRFGMRQADLAEFLDRSVATVRRIENDHITAKNSDLETLAALYEQAKRKRPPNLREILLTKGRLAARKASGIYR